METEDRVRENREQRRHWKSMPRQNESNAWNRAQRSNNELRNFSVSWVNRSARHTWHTGVARLKIGLQVVWARLGRIHVGVRDPN